DFQDFLLLPIGARSYPEALEMAVAVYRSLGARLIRFGYEAALVGDEGGFGPRLLSNEHAAEMILAAFSAAGLMPGRDAAIALDVASTHLYREDRYHLRVPSPKVLTSGEMVALLHQWVEDYPILSIEDGLAEDDWSGWQALTVALGDRVQLVGDDLFVTNPERLRRGIAEKGGNCVVVEVKPIGRLSQAMDVIAHARTAGHRTADSGRAGQTGA